MFSKSAQDILVETEEEDKINEIGNFVRECFDNITLIESKPLDQGVYTYTYIQGQSCGSMHCFVCLCLQ